jgi:hypothetical protein
MWTPAGYMKANKTEYRVLLTKPGHLDRPVLVMATWEKERAEEVKEMLHNKSLVFIEIEEVAL